MLNKVRIVLVNTSHPGNIGGAARAMKNMGLSKLYLVGPQKYPHPEAIWRAASAADILDQAVVTATLDEAIGDCGLVVGTSARERRIPWPLLNPKEFAAVVQKEVTGRDIALIFGREDRGLTNEELQRCNYHVHIPANPEYSALNLATAVQVLTYELRMSYLSNLDSDELAPPEWDMERASVEEIERFFLHLQETLVRLDFLDPNNPKQTMTRLRRLYNRVNLDRMEVNILRGILGETNRAVDK